MPRTLLLIAAGLVIVALIVLAIFAGRPKVKDLPSLSVSARRALSQKVLFPALTKDGTKALFFNDEEADKTGLYRLNLANQSTEIFRPLPVVSNVFWSPTGNRAILSVIYEEERFKAEKSPFLREDAFLGALTWWVFEMESGKLTPLPLEVAGTAWDSSGEKIYYYFLDMVKNVSELAVRDASGGNRESLTPLPDQAAYTIQLLDEKTLLLVPDLSDPEGQASIYVFDLSSKKLTTLAENKVFAAYGSPDGTHILYESVGEEHRWFLLDRTTGRDTDLELTVDRHYAAWVDADRFLVVERQQTSTDRVWLVDVEKLTRQELLLDSSTALHLDRVFPTKSKTLYFTSDNTLYRVDLP